MDNNRYALLTRLGTVAGLVSAIVLLINAGKRAGLLPVTSLTQLVAPLAQLAGIVLFVALLVLVASRGAPLVAGVAAIVSLGSLVGAEFVLNLVLAELPAGTIEALLDGQLGLALTLASVGFLLATVGIVIAWWRLVPRWALLTYGAGATVVSLRPFVPELVLDVALVVMAVGIAGLALAAPRLVREPELAAA